MRHKLETVSRQFLSIKKVEQCRQMKRRLNIGNASAECQIGNWVYKTTSDRPMLRRYRDIYKFYIEPIQTHTHVGLHTHTHTHTHLYSHTHANTYTHCHVLSS